jgi:HD-GYP domain-containing protein (c-di-GMP phosphodiesterase class II)
MLSVELGRFLGLDFKELELLEHAAILHDIGKIGIDNFILQKNGRLSTKEYSIIKTHPLIGDEILQPIGTLDGVRNTIIQHHERYDGTGYPFGIRGDEISLKSKILSVVDTFDAMMTDRPYRKALSIDEVMAELRANAGTQFDAHVVAAFIDLITTDGERILSLPGYQSLAAL